LRACFTRRTYTGDAAAVFVELRLDRLVSHHRGGLGRFVPDGAAPRRYP
jgi:hypothetical protein